MYFFNPTIFRNIIASPHIQKIRKKTLNHDFIQLIISGELPRDDFLFYMRQDASYLTNVCLILRSLAQQLDAKKDYEAGGLLTYRAKRIETQLRAQGYDPRACGSIFFNGQFLEKIPVITAYTNHIQTAAQQSLIEGLCALYPCYDTYRSIGKNTPAHFLHQRHPYHEWLADNLGSFAIQVEQLEEIIERTLNNDSRYHSKGKQATLHNILIESYTFEETFFSKAINHFQSTVENSNGTYVIPCSNSRIFDNNSPEVEHSSYFRKG